MAARRAEPGSASPDERFPTLVAELGLAWPRHHPHTGPMVAPATLAELDRAQYIALTTTKRDGTAVRTPVWFAVDGDTIVVVTESSSGKAKRIRNDAAVRLVRCDARGRTAAGAAELAGTAAILSGADDARADAVLARKYGLTWRAFGLATGLLRVLRRQASPDRVHLGITLSEPTD